ncbi:MAG: redoxin domain-containing protein [Candidatus Fermentibacteraceae bacterium]|nr:redoxin domain-containing protein [Candidatus Fermentibacteraceae bacterium]
MSLLEDYSKDLPMTSLGRKKIRSTVLFLLALMITAFLLSFLFALSPAPPTESILSDVDDFPSEHIWFNSSEPLSLYSQLRRHVVIVFFCRMSTLSDVQYFTRLQDIQTEFRERPLVVVIALETVETSIDELESIVTDWGIDFPVIVDNRGIVSNRFNVSSYPSLLVLDTQARVSARFYTGWEQANLKGIVEDLLQLEGAMRSLQGQIFRPDGESFIPNSLRVES